MTVSHISDSILGSKFGWLSKKPQNWNRVSGLYASASDDSQVPGLKIMTCQWTLLGQDDYLSFVKLFSLCIFNILTGQKRDVIKLHCFHSDFMMHFLVTKLLKVD